MKSLGKLVALLVGSLLSATTWADSNCGKLEERLLFSTDTTAENTEYPWMGILFQLRNGEYKNTRCNVVIVGASHVLTTASCARPFNNKLDTAFVRLGIRNETDSTDDEYICNTNGFCVPSPEQLRVAEIIFHPLADKDTGASDLAILRLLESIKWRANIQPLCVQPISEPSSWISRNFHYAGYRHLNPIMGKGQALAVSKAHCNVLRGTTKPIPANQFCGYPEKQTQLYEGAALMGLNIEKDVPQSFYLVGLVVKRVKNTQTLVYVIQDLLPFQLWLMEHLQ